MDIERGNIEIVFQKIPYLFLIKVFQIFWNLRYFCEFCYFSPYIFIDKYLFWGNSGENERTKRRMDK